jgi:hypothetical protein
MFKKASSNTEEAFSIYIRILVPSSDFGTKTLLTDCGLQLSDCGLQLPDYDLQLPAVIRLCFFRPAFC